MSKTPEDSFQPPLRTQSMSFEEKIDKFGHDVKQAFIKLFAGTINSSDFAISRFVTSVVALAAQEYPKPPSESLNNNPLSESKLC